MPVRTKFMILKDLLAPHVGEIVHLDRLRLLLIRNMGTSGNSIANLLRFAQDSKLIAEREPFKYEILEVKEAI